MRLRLIGIWPFHFSILLSSQLYIITSVICDSISTQVRQVINQLKIVILQGEKTI